MGSATSSIPAEPIVAAAAAAGALGYGYVHYFRPLPHSGGDEDAYSDVSAGAPKATSTLHGQKKRGRKLQLPGDATLKNLDILDASVRGSLSVSSSASKTRERRLQPPLAQQQQQREAPAAHAQSREVVPGGFDAAVTADDVRDTPQGQSHPPLEPQQVQRQQRHVSVGATKKPKKKKGKKTAAVAAPSDPSSASAVGASPSLATPASAAAAVDAQDERWTRVEARKKKVTVPPQDGLAELHSAEATAADVTTSDAGVTTSVTGNSSPMTERTTEDELRSELDECVFLPPRRLPQISDWSAICAFGFFFLGRSALGVSASSSQDAQPPIVPVRPPPGEKPAKGFTWEDYEGVQVGEDASDEDDGGWGVVRSRRSQFILHAC